MTGTRQERAQLLLRSLLPEFYWVRDRSSDGVLGALIDALAIAYAGLQEEVEGVYDDLFIETCHEMIVPYIGEGVGVTGLAPISGPGVSHRAWVGQVVGLRRRKGTLTTVGRGVAAAIGWPAYVQDGAVVVARTQDLARVRTALGRTVDLRDLTSLAGPQEPWSELSRTSSFSGHPIEAGYPTSGRPASPAGYPSPRSVGIAIYRIGSYWIEGRTAAPIDGIDGAFTFHPLGIDAPLFTNPEPAPRFDSPPGIGELPLPLTIGALARRLAAGRSGPFHVRIPDHRQAIPATKMTAADLSQWRAPGGRHHELLVDPELGRLLFTGAKRPRRLSVSYCFGLPGELGGGPYVASLQDADPPDALYLTVGAEPKTQTLDSALAAAADADAAVSVIVIPGNTTRTTPSGEWKVNVGPQRSVRIRALPGAAPALDGRLSIVLGAGASVQLRGLLISGPIRVHGAGDLDLAHCTICPRPDVASIELCGERLRLSLKYTITGAIATETPQALIAERPSVDATACIIDGDLRVARGTLDLRETTVFGRIDGAHTVLAESCILTAPVEPSAVRSMRFSYLAGAGLPRPRFASTRFGDAAFGQLALDCPPEIAAGAEAGGEMGAFNWLGQPDRFSRLPVVLRQLLPVSVTASVTYRT